MVLPPLLFPQFSGFGTLDENQWTINTRVYFWTIHFISLIYGSPYTSATPSFLLLCSQFWHQSVSSPTFFFFSMILAVLGPFYSHVSSSLQLIFKSILLIDWLIHSLIHSFIHSFRKCAEGQRDRERISSKCPTEWGARCGARSHNLEIMTPVEIKSWMLNQLRNPGAPGSWILYK